MIGAALGGAISLSMRVVGARGGNTCRGATWGRKGGLSAARALGPSYEDPEDLVREQHAPVGEPEPTAGGLD